MSSPKDKHLIEEVKDIMRLKHYSIHTKRSYCDWIKRFVKFHKMSSRQDLGNGEQKIEAFLTRLAVDADIAPATQNQAMKALIFLYKNVLKVPLEKEINVVRAAQKINIPVVMTRDEVRQVIHYMEGTPQLVVKLLYGSGLRILENHIAKVKILHEQDLAGGFGAVYLPHALSRKYSKAEKQFNWQYVFPSRSM